MALALGIVAMLAIVLIGLTAMAVVSNERAWPAAIAAMFVATIAADKLLGLAL